MIVVEEVGDSCGNIPTVIEVALHVLGSKAKEFAEDTHQRLVLQLVHTLGIWEKRSEEGL